MSGLTNLPVPFAGVPTASLDPRDCRRAVVPLCVVIGEDGAQCFMTPKVGASVTKLTTDTCDYGLCWLGRKSLKSSVWAIDENSPHTTGVDVPDGSVAVVLGDPAGGQTSTGQGIETWVMLAGGVAGDMVWLTNTVTYQETDNCGKPGPECIFVRKMQVKIVACAPPIAC